MPRYVDGNQVRFTVKDRIFLDTEFYSGEKFEALEPRRLFPVSGGNKYIALLDENGNNVAVIRDLDAFPQEEKEKVLSALEEFYNMPRILRFIKMTEKYRIWMWTAETDKGVITFEIRNHLTAVKPLFDGRILIKDANDNRYEIPKFDDLDKKSKKMLFPKL
ncbi:MAG: DUF1854 domain-containing protein [Clostridia bacterium]|nr:DUF1854 domain-containing protein [Clostridia bacterium]MBR5427962.1 DUF1854 domain-containing protein [Clostridia bacterium]